MKKVVFISLILIIVSVVGGCSDKIETVAHTTPVAYDISEESSVAVTSEPSCTTNEAVESGTVEVMLNSEAFSELGMTYSQLTDKYGEATGGWYNVHCFEDSFGGGYAFEFRNMTDEEDLENMGGVFMIDGVQKEKLFQGITFPMGFDELEQAYGIECTECPEEKDGMSEMYYAQFIHKLYPDCEIRLYTNEKGIIDTDSSCVMRVIGEV